MYKLPELLESKYRFVTLASKRAEQLQMGSMTRAESTVGRKVTVMAQEEIATGKIEPYDPDLEADAAPLEEEEEE